MRKGIRGAKLDDIGGKSTFLKPAEPGLSIATAKHAIEFHDPEYVLVDAIHKVNPVEIAAHYYQQSKEHLERRNDIPQK